MHVPPRERSKKDNEQKLPQQQRKLIGICCGMIKCIELLEVAVNQRHYTVSLYD
jgi:hypothetical protein